MAQISNSQNQRNGIQPKVSPRRVQQSKERPGNLLQHRPEREGRKNTYPLRVESREEEGAGLGQHSRALASKIEGSKDGSNSAGKDRDGTGGQNP